MSQSPLITRGDLVSHGASSDFLGQFAVRSIQISCVTGGTLGTATFAWRVFGDASWSAEERSDTATPWTWELPDQAWCTATFAAGTYTAGDTWDVSQSGTVTPVDIAPDTVEATRLDIVADTIASVTSDAVTWMQPRVVPPVISLGTGQKGWLAVLAIYRLKSRQGMTPTQAGTGDENLRARALDAEENLKNIGGSAQRPPDIVDSSATGAGAGIPLMPASDDLRGW